MATRSTSHRQPHAADQVRLRPGPGGWCVDHRRRARWRDLHRQRPAERDPHPPQWHRQPHRHPHRQHRLGVCGRHDAEGWRQLQEVQANTFESRRGTEVIFGAPAGTSVASPRPPSPASARAKACRPAPSPAGPCQPRCHRLGLRHLPQLPQSGPANGPGDFTLTSITNGNARGGNFGIEEVDRGWYAQLDFSKARLGDIPVRGDIGTRFVKTQVLSTGYLATGGGTRCRSRTPTATCCLRQPHGRADPQLAAACPVWRR